MPATVQPAFTLSGDRTDVHLLRAALRTHGDRLANIVADLEREVKGRVHVEQALARYRDELARVQRMLADLDPAPHPAVSEVTV